MNYYATFIHIAPDSRAAAASVPVTKGKSTTVPVLEYELLSARPYFFTQEELQFAVHIKRLGVSDEEVQTRRAELWAEFFAKPRACMRTSSLAKTYGWGIHFDGEGKIGLIAMESEEYRRFALDAKLQHTAAMRTSRGR